jgi:hypothetical protein
MPNDFNFRVNIEQVAQKLGQTADVVQNKVADVVEKLVASTHAFVVQKAQSELGDFKRTILPGPPDVDGMPKNVKWMKVAERIWVVEIMPEAAWIEEGRPQTSMATEEWLLKPGKAKTAKDGSKYRAIPFTHSQFVGKDKPVTATSEVSKPALAAIAKRAIKDAGINLKKIERYENGDPKLGVLHKLPAEIFDYHRGVPGFSSKARSPEDAAKSGLPPHQGIPYLSGLAVTQRINAKGKVTREAVTWRMVSSKHKLEGRWEYPAVQPFGALPAAVKYAEQEWAKMLEIMEREYRAGT